MCDDRKYIYLIYVRGLLHCSGEISCLSVSLFTNADWDQLRRAECCCDPRYCQTESAVSAWLGLGIGVQHHEAVPALATVLGWLCWVLHGAHWYCYHHQPVLSTLQHITRSGIDYSLHSLRAFDKYQQNIFVYFYTAKMITNIITSIDNFVWLGHYYWQGLTTPPSTETET